MTVHSRDHDFNNEKSSRYLTQRHVYLMANFQNGPYVQKVSSTILKIKCQRSKFTFGTARKFNEYVNNI